MCISIYKSLYLPEYPYTLVLLLGYSNFHTLLFLSCSVFHLTHASMGRNHKGKTERGICKNCCSEVKL